MSGFPGLPEYIIFLKTAISRLPSRYGFITTRVRQRTPCLVEFARDDFVRPGAFFSEVGAA